MDRDPPLSAWLDDLTDALDHAPPVPARVVLAHSLGCWLWVHAQRQRRLPPPDRLLLVAPPSPAWVDAYLLRFPAPSWADLAAAVGETDADVVVGGGDELLPAPDRAALLAAVPQALEVPGGGHLHTAAGYGPWPAVRAWVDGDVGALRAQTVPLAP